MYLMTTLLITLAVFMLTEFIDTLTHSYHPIFSLKLMLPYSAKFWQGKKAANHPSFISIQYT